MSEIVEVKWRRGFQSKIDAEKAYTEIEKVKEKNSGTLTAGLVVNAAKSKRSPLHNQFEWDDAEAAEQHRLEQARGMLRSIEVVYKKAPHLKPQRHFVAVKEAPIKGHPPRKVYRSTEEVLQDPVARDELLGNAIREAISFRRKYAALSELAGIFKAVDQYMENAG